MTFSDSIRSRLGADETVAARLMEMTWVAEDMWNLVFRFRWKDLGPVEVRTASLADHAAVRDFLTEGLSARSRYLFAPYPMDERLDASIEKMLVDSGKREQLTYNAWHGGRVIGHFFLWEYDQDTPALGIAVADAFQNCKLGHVFMHILTAAARSAGKSAIQLTTNYGNGAGFHLYSKLGFKHVGDQEIVLGDGSRRVEREMRLDLGAKTSAPDTG